MNKLIKVFKKWQYRQKWRRQLRVMAQADWLAEGGSVK
jgi:hypothetical protein